MGSYAKKYRNYIGSIFIFIFVSNISGLFGLRPPTADYGVTLPLGIITFCIIQYNNVKYNKFGAFTDLFKPIPILFPINLIGEIASAVFSVTASVRKCAFRNGYDVTDLLTAFQDRSGLAGISSYLL